MVTLARSYEGYEEIEATRPPRNPLTRLSQYSRLAVYTYAVRKAAGKEWWGHEPRKPPLGGDGGSAVLGSGVAFAAVKFGTDGRDVLIGTKGEDVLYGRGGSYVLAGRGSDDALHGGDGPDYMHGG